MILELRRMFCDFKESEQRIEKISDYFIDPRDGQKYRTVNIGGKVWMAQNLNYKPQTGNSWCYGNDNSNGCKYGRLYDWDTAMSVSPAGWHLPTGQEWNDLVTAVGGGEAGKALKSVIGWSKVGDGTDEYGFSALPGGYYRGGSFGVVGNYGRWWAAAEDSDGLACYLSMNYGYDNVDEDYGDKGYGRSVRCVKDA